MVWITPGDDGTPRNFGVARFTLPAGGDGDYKIQTWVSPLFDGASSADSDFHVVKNGQEVFGQFLAPNTQGGYTNTIHLVSGDTIDLDVGRGADGLQAGTALKIQASLSLVVAVNEPPVAKATIRPLANLSSKITNPQIISTNGSNATVILDGSLSTDEENDPLQFFWSTNGAPFAVGIITTNVLELCTYTITLTVTEAGASASDTLTLDIISTDQATEELGLLVDGSTLSRNAKRPLIASLKMGMASLARGDSQAGVNQLQAFQNKVRAQVGRTDPDLAAALIRAAQVIIDAVGSAH